MPRSLKDLSALLLPTIACGLLTTLFFVSVFGFVDAASWVGKRVKIERKGLPVLEGRVLSDDGVKIELQRPYNRLWIRHDSIARIRPLPKASEELKTRSAICKTAKDWVKVAIWCKRGDVQLKNAAKKCLKEALKIDPKHERANQMFGNVKVRGQWYGEEEGNKMLGKVKADNGKWMTPEEMEEYERQKKIKANPRIAAFLDGLKTREGRPWATVEAIETEHYLVKCNSTEPVARRYSQLMEDLYEKYDELFDEDEFPRYHDEKGTVYIFRNRWEYVDFKPRIGPFSGGYYDQLDRAVRAFHGGFGVSDGTEEVLAHEATHQFQGWIFKEMMSAPPWLVEGMAVYYGDGSEITKSGVQLHVIPRARLRTLKMAMRTKRYRPLERLLVTSSGRAFGPYYDHGWGVIYWCLQGEKYGEKDGQNVWDRYLKHVAHELLPFEEARKRWGQHLVEEKNLFIEILLEETGYSSVSEWEKDYRKFVMEKLELEALGSWKGRSWRGIDKVGLGLTFPAASDLEVVPEEELEPYEAAAMRTEKDGGLRIWVTVAGNGEEQFGEKFALGTVARQISGFFERVRYRRTGSFSPRVHVSADGKPFYYAGEEDFPVITASFSGKLKANQAVGIGGNDASSPSKKGKKGEKKGSKTENGGLEPGKRYRVSLAFLMSPEKFYTVLMAGSTKAHARMAPMFDGVIQSIKIEF